MTTMLTIRLPEEEKLRLQEYAKKYDLTVSQVIRKAIRLIVGTGKTIY